MQKKIPYNNKYLIDENGKVLNTETGQYLRGSYNETGYHYYRLSKNGKKKMFFAHRLVAEAFIPNPNDYPVVNHIDGNKINNSVNNLEWCTYSENTQHWRDNKKIIRQQTEYYTEDLPNEIWKECYHNYYISSCGRVRHKIKNNLLHPSITNGYYKVRLSYNGLIQDFMVHQLEYEIFNGGYDKTKYIIDHIDGDKLNNNLDNLRLLTNSQNSYAALYEQKTNSSAKKVAQYDLDGNYMATFLSTRDAASKLNLDSSTISKVCRGINKTHGGFTFKYV